MSAIISRLDFARTRTLGANVELRLLEKRSTGYFVTFSIKTGFHVGSRYSSSKGAHVDVLVIDESAACPFDKLHKAVGVDIAILNAVDALVELKRYAFDSGKPPALAAIKRYQCDLRANFGDQTAYAT